MGETNMWEKIETFLFDIMGLLLPGIVFLVGMPLTLMLLLSSDITNSIWSGINHLVLFDLLQSMSKQLNNHFWLIVVFFLFTAYLIGHAIKVFSKIHYRFFELLFDKFINKIVKFIIEEITTFIKRLLSPIFRLRLFSRIRPSLKNNFKGVLLSTTKFITSIVNDIFVFKTQNYEEANEPLLIESMILINKNFSTDFPENWYSFYKFSKIIIYHENLKNMNDTFLAKYNLYRSLSFITFIQVALIFIIYFNDFLINEHTRMIAIILLIINFIFLFTFHEKYKRYFKLCGNETLVAVYYYLKKKEQPSTL